MTRKSTSRKNIQSTGLTANGMIMRMKFHPQSKKPVTEQTSEQKSSEEDQKTQPEKNETSVKKEKGLEVFDLNDL